MNEFQIGHGWKLNVYTIIIIIKPVLAIYSLIFKYQKVFKCEAGEINDISFDMVLSSLFFRRREKNHTHKTDIYITNAMNYLKGKIFTNWKSYNQLEI